MRIPTAHRHAEAGTIDQAMTPMIDIVFLLLIFFVCASVGQSVEDVLPTELSAGAIGAARPEPPPEQLEPLWIKLIRTGDHTAVELNGTRHPNLDNLSNVLAGLRQAGATDDLPVVLDVSNNVPIGDALRVYDESLAAGFASIDFAVDTKN